MWYFDWYFRKNIYIIYTICAKSCGIYILFIKAVLCGGMVYTCIYCVCTSVQILNDFFDYVNFQSSQTNLSNRAIKISK